MRTWLGREVRHFMGCPHAMRVLLLTNLIYAFVLPVIDIFVAAYIMRNSAAPGKVMTYQLAVYTGIPLTFFINGFLLQHIAIRWLYSAGMLLSGVSMVGMMALPNMDLAGLILVGLVMGMSFGLFWANRDYLALSTTDDGNRNYYYGTETFFYTLTYVVVPLAVGWFIEGHTRGAWLGTDRNAAYYAVTGAVFVFTTGASLLVQRGNFTNPPRTRFVYFRFHPLWMRMQLLAVLKGIAQGYIVTAPAMLVLRLVGQEGALGTIQAVGGVVAALVLYAIGRIAAPRHRLAVFGVALVLFVLGALANAALYNTVGVLLFMLCLLLARPLHDIAYFPIQMLAINTVAAIERRNEFAYIANQEFAFLVGRWAGCGLFIVLAGVVGDTFALRYALLIIGAIQLLAIPAAQRVLQGCAGQRAAHSVQGA